MNQNKPKIKIAIMSDPMDRRPERAFAPKRLVENLLKDPELEITLVHFKKMDDEPLYGIVSEIIIPLLPLPWASHFFSFMRFCLTTEKKFDISYWLIPRIYPFFWFFPSKKIVVTAHDGYIGLWTFANTIHWFFLRFFNRKVHGIIGVSEYGKKEIMSTYHFPESKAFAAFNGVDPIYHHVSFDEALPILKRYNIFEDRYFLYVGSMAPHKNVKKLVQAYLLLREIFPTKQKLVFVGKKSFPEDISKIVENSKYKEDIILVGFVPLEDMSAFYSNAVSLVFVSLAEGFGMPIIEAMACGTAVIASNLSALPEAAGDAGILVDPHNPEEIMKAMRQVSQNEILRKSLIDKGYKQASLFTWERYAQGTVYVFKKVLRN